MPEVPGDHVKLDDARRQLSVARETMLNQVRAGRRNAVYVVQGKRRGRRIEIHSGEQSGCRAPSSHDLVSPLNVASVKHPRRIPFDRIDIMSLDIRGVSSTLRSCDSGV